MLEYFLGRISEHLEILGGARVEWAPGGAGPRELLGPAWGTCSDFSGVPGACLKITQVLAAFMKVVDHGI